MGYVYLPVLISAIFCLGLFGCDRPNHAQSTNVASTISERAVPQLIEATLANDSEQVKSLLQNGTDPNLIHNTNTALTYAARDGFTEIAKLLIANGADINWIDGEGVTPLILASFKNNLEITVLLLHHGADKKVKDQWNRSALDYALRRGEADPIAKLLQI